MIHNTFYRLDHGSHFSLPSPMIFIFCLFLFSVFVLFCFLPTFLFYLKPFLLLCLLQVPFPFPSHSLPHHLPSYFSTLSALLSSHLYFPPPPFPSSQLYSIALILHISLFSGIDYIYVLMYSFSIVRSYIPIFPQIEM